MAKITEDKPLSSGVLLYHARSVDEIARIEFQNEDLPKTSTFKVQRAKVRERYQLGKTLSALNSKSNPAGRSPSTRKRW